MDRAFVDTTVLFDALVKPGEHGKTARAALRRYKTTELPVYAIKELKVGPLSNFVWFHNKLIITKSFFRALRVLQSTSLTPRKYRTATALEALALGAFQSRNLTSGDLVERYGDKAKLDPILHDQWRLSIRIAIEKAWKKRRRMTSEVVLPLSCYEEVAPYEEDKLLKLSPTACDIDPECCLAAAMKARPDDLIKLIAAIDSQPSKPENQRRRKVLKEMYRIPKRYVVTNQACRDLGDAIFALFAPADSTVLTTNLKDHLPLAQALGKTATEP